ncbi:dynein axonemal assembly factor 1 homolog [Portunus trituberculatus]|uniref:dynein axonemal assembly factor 1 homolog n=1 Tax=Portunus trituberculatus TaxID=210409 RepID=UPI001E1CD74B|nr:dynein axonemal assembly factor 1 homolog [Portunus trituberculatus]
MERQNEGRGGPRMTKEALKKLCKQHNLYSVPALNDVLYLHFQGYTEIENLEEYTGLRCLWLENNGLRRITGLDHLRNLRSLHLHHNLLTSLAGLQHLASLVTLNVSYNMIRNIEHISSLVNLETLQITHNRLSSVACLTPLASCPVLSSLDLSHNNLQGPGLALALGEVRSLRCLQATGNPATREVRPYRNTFILTCPELTYLDDRPVFPVDRAAALAWQGGGVEAERETRKEWAERKHRRQRECVDDLLKLRQRVLAERAAKEETPEGAAAPDATSDMGIYVQDDGHEKIYALTPEAKAWAMKRLKKAKENEEEDELQKEGEEESAHTNTEKVDEENEKTVEMPDVKEKAVQDEESDQSDQSDLYKDEGFKTLLGFLSEGSDDLDNLCVLNNTRNAGKSSEIMQREYLEEIIGISPEDQVEVLFPENHHVEGLSPKHKVEVPCSVDQVDSLSSKDKIEVLSCENLANILSPEDSVNDDGVKGTSWRETETGKPKPLEDFHIAQLFNTETQCSNPCGEVGGDGTDFLKSRNASTEPEYDDLGPRLSLSLRYQEEEEEEEAEDNEERDQLFLRSCHNFIRAHTATTENPGLLLEAEGDEASCSSLHHHHEQLEEEEEETEGANQDLFLSSQSIIRNTECNTEPRERNRGAAEAEEQRLSSPNLDSDQYTQAFLRELVARHQAAAEDQSDIEEILDNLDLEAEETMPVHPRHPHAHLLRQLANGSEPESGDDEEPITRRPLNGMRLPPRHAGVPVFGERWVEEVRRSILEDADWEEEIESSIDTSEEEGSVDDLNVETPEESSLAEDDSSWQDEDSVFEEESVSDVSSAGKVVPEGAGRNAEGNNLLDGSPRTQTDAAALRTPAPLSVDDEDSNTTSCSSLSLTSLQNSPAHAIYAPQGHQDSPWSTMGEGNKHGKSSGRERKTEIGNFIEDSPQPQFPVRDVSSALGDLGESAATAPAAAESASSCMSGDASGCDAVPPGFLKEDHLSPQEIVNIVASEGVVQQHEAGGGASRQRGSRCSTRDALRSSHEAFVRGHNITGRRGEPGGDARGVPRDWTDHDGEE